MISSRLFFATALLIATGAASASTLRGLKDNTTALDDDFIEGDLSLFDPDLQPVDLEMLELIGDGGDRRLGDISDDEDAKSDTADNNTGRRLVFTKVLTNRATGYVLDSNGNGNVYTSSYNGGNFQKWKFYRSGSTNVYFVQNVGTNRVLDSNGEGHVYTSGYNGGNYQKWKLYANAGGTLFFQSLATSKVLDCNIATSVYTNPYYGNDYQSWRW